MAKSTSVSTETSKVPTPKPRHEAELRSAVSHLEEMHEPVIRLNALLNVLSKIDPNQDGPEAEPLSETFHALWDLAYEIKEHHDGFWHHYDVWSGDAERAKEIKQQMES